MRPRYLKAYWPVLIVLAAVILWPLAQLIEEGFRATSFTQVTWAALGASLTTSAAAALLATAGGVLAALATETAPIRGRNSARVGIVGALLVPPFASAVAWKATYGPGGVTDDLLGLSINWIEGPVGVAVVIAINVLPLSYLLTAASLATGSDREMIRAARISGASRRDAFTSVTLPLLRPSIYGGLAITFLAGMNSFGVPIVLGTPAGFRTLTVEVYRSLVRSAEAASFARAIGLALTLTVVALLGALATEWPARRPNAAITRLNRRPAGRPTTGSRVIAAGLWIYVTAAFVIPLLGLLAAALVRSIGLDPVPGNWSIRNFETLTSPRVAEALIRSLALAIGAATVVAVLGATSAALRKSGRSLPSRMAAIGFAVPGSALAVAVLLGYLRVLGAGLLLIAIAYVAKFWVLADRPLGAALERLGEDAGRAARVSGASPARAFATITGPLAWPAVAVAWTMVFLFSLHELTMSSLLHGPGSTTLAVVILDFQQIGETGATAALAIALTALVILGGIPLVSAVSRLSRRLEGRVR